MKKPKSIRIGFLSDLHCGHRSGLTPPGWQYKPDQENYLSKWANTQKECWDWYVSTVTKLKLDIAIWVGDLIDGTGRKSGGTELITSDRNAQCDMALTCIRKAGAKINRIVRGTPYHTGEQEDMENMIASLLDCKIGDHEWYDINGVVFDVKHFISGSSIPHGRLTAVKRAQMWNKLWALKGHQPEADVIIRAHVHYYQCAEDSEGVAMILPSLQGYGSKFGAKQCEGTIDFGMVHFDVPEDSGYSFEAHLMKDAPHQKASAECLT